MHSNGVSIEMHAADVTDRIYRLTLPHSHVSMSGHFSPPSPPLLPAILLQIILVCLFEFVCLSDEFQSFDYS